MLVSPDFLLLRHRGIGINRLQTEPFCDFLFLALLSHKGSQIEHQVPGLIGLDVVRKRRHRSAVQTSHEDPVNVLIGVATFWASSIGEVKRRDGTTEIILQGGSRWPVGHTLDAMALPALHAGEYITPGLDALGSDFGLGRNGDRSSRFFIWLRRAYQTV